MIKAQCRSVRLKYTAELGYFDGALGTGTPIISTWERIVVAVRSSLCFGGGEGVNMTNSHLLSRPVTRPS